jgi:hypothetical protein
VAKVALTVDADLVTAGDDLGDQSRRRLDLLTEHEERRLGPDRVELVEHRRGGLGRGIGSVVKGQNGLTARRDPFDTRHLPPALRPARGVLLEEKAQRERQKAPEAMQMSTHIPITRQQPGNFCGCLVCEYWVSDEYVSDDG